MLQKCHSVALAEHTPNVMLHITYHAALHHPQKLACFPVHYAQEKSRTVSANFVVDPKFVFGLGWGIGIESIKFQL